MPANTSPIIKVERLSYEYPGLRALDNVSFTIAGGSITALVGPNGAGKTTLLRCLAGMDRPLSGSITVNGIDVVEEPRHSHQCIGYLSDFFGLYEDLSVRQSLTYVAAANGMAQSQIRSIIDQAAQQLGLSARLDQRAGDLSRGLRQRVAIAHAVIHSPQVILLDEPASGLDPEARYQLGELFIALKQSGMTLLISSHILAELEAYSTDILILRDGRMLEQRGLGSLNADTCVLEIAVQQTAETALALLDLDGRVSAVVAGEEVIQFHFAGDASARAALLREFVERGVEVSHFAAVAEDLQQSYLRSISHADGDNES